MPKSTLKPVLGCRGLSVELNGQAVLKQLNLEVYAGEFVVLLGLNGAGKSTLLRTLAGLVPVVQGQIERRGRLALLAQGGGLIPQLTVLENVLCGRLGPLGSWSTLWGFPQPERTQALALLSQLGLGAYPHTPTRQLSGGQQQRVALARALMASAEIILADEPITGLDIHATEQVMQALQDLTTQGKTVVATLHDLELAEAYGQRALVLDRGKLVYDGPCLDLKQYLTLDREVAAA